MEQAYVYKWTELSTGKWYIGSRTAKGCHINDGYICSSKIVKPLVIANPNNWEREILCIGNQKYILELESKFLLYVNACDDDLSYNQHNQNGKFSRVGVVESDEIRKKESKARQGEKNPSFAKRGSLSANFGKKYPLRSESHKRKLSEALKGKTSWNKGMKMPSMTKEVKDKISQALKGRTSPNKGNICPNVGISNKKRTGIKRHEHSKWMTGRTWHCAEKICPHCGKVGSGGNMQRYHFDNCKEI